MKVRKQIRPIEVLATARWITLAEACEYMCVRSVKTVKSLILAGKIYGTKRGEWIIDRESIDRYYNEERDKRRAILYGRGYAVN